SVFYHGRIKADFPITDPANLEGELTVTESVLVNDGQRIQFDSVQILAGKSDSGHFMRVRSDAINLVMTGQYNLLQLGTIFQDAIQPYFAVLPPHKVTAVDPYDFTLHGTIVNHPTLQAFVPDLQRLDPVTVDGRFSNTNGWQLDLNSPLILMGANRIQGVTFRAGTENGAIAFSTNLTKFNSGTAMNVYGASITGTVANNQINFNVNVKDKAAKNKYQLGGLFEQPSTGNYAVSLSKDSLLLNYQRWSISDGNSINFGSAGVFARNFILSRDIESLSINSLSPSGKAPVEVKFANFQIGTITAFIQSDTLLADGAINGNVVFNNLMSQPTFTSDLTVNDLSIRRDTLGNLRMQVNNTTANTFTADVTLNGHGNDLQLAGNYYVKPNNNSNFDLKLDIRQLQLNTLEGASMGAFTDGSGYISGKFVFNGTIKDPNIDGSIGFTDAGFTPTALGSHFTIEKESILFANNEGVKFNTFTVKDNLGSTAILDGMAYTKNFLNYNFDLKLRANDFQGLNTTKRDNPLYFGQLYFSSNLGITGTEKAPVIDGSITINEKTKLSVVLPQQQVGMVDREGIVQFVDMDSLSRDSVFLAYDSVNRSSLVGFDIGVNIEVKKEAELSLIIDQGSGDFIKMRGEGLLTGGIDPSGKITLSGSYEIEEGAYELSFNFLRRKFNLQKGSKILWTGEPTDADLSLTAVYVANTSPLDLVDNYLGETSTQIKNTYRQKLPFEVSLILKGQLLHPEITFDVTLPEKNYGVSNDIVTTVQFRLDEIRSEPSELNKQVFALLLLNRFVGENPFESSGGGGGLNAGTFARQSVSKLLSEQLNQLAGNLIQGVDINFDLVTSEDYTTGQMHNRTDFNVSLSKRLLDDRLTVTVGSNFELEGPQKSTSNSGSNLAGNIAIDYQLSQDGRYRLRAYRKNEFEGVVEGYIVETGIGFAITMDYNRFRDLFRKRKRPVNTTDPNNSIDNKNKTIPPAPATNSNE
ncbi:MAG TPA: translocation/assembly module TamB domain-containing protein, partial [Flavitalea sp.]|nr:translocation/assembly module TamB domain-containing protein [Flavitalea sp.]